jgi:hypothetical protein
MKAWQLTTGLAIVAVGAGWLAARAQDDTPRWVPVPPRNMVDRSYELNERFRGVSIDRFVKADPRIGDCVAEAQSNRVGLPPVVVRMHVLPDGTVDDATVEESGRPSDSDLAKCIETTLESMGFPEPDDDTATWVTFPLKF